MILLADVNISPAVVTRLREDGFEVVRIGERLDVRASDQEIIAEAVRLDAVVVSRDQDFSAILATTNATGPSLVNVRSSVVDSLRLAERIGSVVRALESDLVAGAIVTIDDGGVRVHRLPVG